MHSTKHAALSCHGGWGDSIAMAVSRTAPSCRPMWLTHAVCWFGNGSAATQWRISACQPSSWESALAAVCKAQARRHPGPNCCACTWAVLVAVAPLWWAGTCGWASPATPKHVAARAYHNRPQDQLYGQAGEVAVHQLKPTIVLCREQLSGAEIAPAAHRGRTGSLCCSDSWGWVKRPWRRGGTWNMDLGVAPWPNRPRTSPRNGAKPQCARPSLPKLQS